MTARGMREILSEREREREKERETETERYRDRGDRQAETEILFERKEER